ncbi:hypothetical protein [Pseudogemmobacter sonorensis]|uniref:hypothetical protein n=1 Tax=Pseudogemmobacter sonorensis TaxID=2989681 RepID=UPI0036CB5DA5
MLEYLPKELRDGFEAARKRALRRHSRLHIELGGVVFPVLRYWENGFALRADVSPRALRGLVDLFDGPRHIFQCLIIASEIEGDELTCIFKRATPVVDRAALDYWHGEDEPRIRLPRM